jgi:osmotically inducible lipoprotein OsmB
VQPTRFLLVRSGKEYSEDTSMIRVVRALVVTALAVGTAACGERALDRALTGGVIGAGGGALIGVAAGNPVAGAVVGGLGGAAIGAATTPRNNYYYGRR